jgi:hypothetical protein
MNLQLIIHIMKTIKNTIYLLTAGLLIIAAGCDTVNPDAEQLTDEELEMAAEIIGESLSESGGGLLSSLYDAVSDVDEEGIRYERTESVNQSLMADRQRTESIRRGTESDYNANYNPETGEHTIAYRRGYQGELFSKTLHVHSVYIFTDIEGEFLEFPKRQQDQIETIDFKGTREGTASGPRRSSSFSRADTLFLDGVSSASTILTLEGTHHGSGEMSANLRTRNRPDSRSYEVQFKMSDIRVDKEIVRENGPLEDGITGFISYRLKMTQTVNGQTRERLTSGTVELTGDGNALLRFDKVQDFFRIALRNGELHLN